MALITLEELARGACIGVFGGVAGVCTLAFPGSPVWLVPAAAAVGGCALTVPEVRQEVVRAWPAFTSGAQRARAALPRVAWQLPGVKQERRPQSRTEAPERATAPAAAPQGPPPLMPALNGAQRVLVVGASDTGKTTLLRHMLEQRGGGLVLDPHASPGKWGRAKVVGAGRDYQAIATTLGQVVATMDRRYDEIARGVVAEGRHPKQTLVIDEWRSITRNVDGAGEQIALLLTEARKANIDLVLAGHSANVKALNLEGEGDLRDGFQIVRLQKVGEERRATLDMGEGPQPYSLPGAYHEPAPAPADDLLVSLLTADAPVTKPSLDERIAAVLGNAQPVTSASQRGVTATAINAEGNGNGSTQAAVTVTPGGSGAVVKVYATAQVTGAGRRPRGRGLDMRARRARAQAQRKGDDLTRAYAEARAAGVPSFRQAFKQIGGNSKEALAAWQAAAPVQKGAAS